MKPLFEKYRPTLWTEVCGQDVALDQLAGYIGRGAVGGRAFWISGASGVGKTTIARLLAGEVADPWFTQELDASAMTPAGLKDAERAMHLSAWGKGGRAYIVNEAHGLAQHTIRQLEVLLERLPEHVTFIFTTTRAGQAELFEGAEDPAPLLSRCVTLSLDDRPVEAFARRAQYVAQLEGLEDAGTDYRALAQRCNCNLRRMIQAVERGGQEPSAERATAGAEGRAA